jgi:hypothetical protein
MPIAVAASRAPSARLSGVYFRRSGFSQTATLVDCTSRSGRIVEQKIGQLGAPLGEGYVELASASPAYGSALMSTFGLKAS